MKYFIGFAAVICGLLFFIRSAQARVIEPGELIKGSTPAVYYFSDGKRYVFPTEAVYESWYENFDAINTVADETLATLPLGGNVTFRPGSLIKLTTDPKVYMVEKGVALRWITTESVARQLFGNDWSVKVRDVSDAYFIDYAMGEHIADTDGYDSQYLPAAYNKYQDVLDDVKEIAEQAKYANTKQAKLDTFIHPSGISLVAIMDNGYNATTSLQLADLAAYFKNNAQGWESLYDHKIENASATMAILNYSQKTTDWFKHRSVIIAHMADKTEREIIFTEITYPKGYIVYPYAATGNFQQGEVDTGQGFFTHHTENEIMDWYQATGLKYGWGFYEKTVDSSQLVSTYRMQQDNERRLLRVNFVDISILPDLQWFGAEYLKTIR